MTTDPIRPKTLIRIEKEIKSDPIAFAKFISHPQEYLKSHGVDAAPELLDDISDAAADACLTPESFDAIRTYIRKCERERAEALALTSAFP